MHEVNLQIIVSTFLISLISSGLATHRGAGLYEIYTIESAGPRWYKKRRDRIEEVCNRLVPWPMHDVIATQWQHCRRGDLYTY